jgi:hypothetical protein
MAILPDVLLQMSLQMALGRTWLCITKDIPVGYIEAKDIGVDLVAKN